MTFYLQISGRMQRDVVIEEQHYHYNLQYVIILN